MIINASNPSKNDLEAIYTWLDNKFCCSVGATFFLKYTQDQESPWQLFWQQDGLTHQILGVAVLTQQGTCFWVPAEDTKAALLYTEIIKYKPTQLITTAFGRDIFKDQLKKLSLPIRCLKEFDQWAMIHSGRFTDKKGRLATKLDIPRLIEYQTNYNAERNINAALTQWDVLISEAKILVYEYQGIIVSIIRLGLQTKRVITLGGTYTFPAYRHQGFAESLLKFAIDWIVSTGHSAYLIVDVDNQPAIQLYQKLGFTCVGSTYVVYTEYT